MRKCQGVKSHLRITNEEIRIIVLDDFQPAGDFAGVLHKGRETERLILCFITSARYSGRATKWILSDLADFDHIQFFLEPCQHGVIVAPGALGDCAPLLGVWVEAAHQKAGHDAPWWVEEQSIKGCLKPPCSLTKSTQ